MALYLGNNKIASGGTPATLEVGTTTTGEAGTNAEVTNSGTSSNAIFDFVIPRGADGKKIELQTTSTYIQWRYAGDTTWNNLIALSELKGATGEAGSDGTDGVSITSVTQTTTSTADGGTNVVTVTLSNGTKTTFNVKNGSKGSTGTAGVSVSSVTQTTTSTADGGTNVITCKLSNGTTTTFNIKNGSKGSTGATGASTITQIRNSTAWTLNSAVTYTGGANGYKFYIILGKVVSSNSGYNTAMIPADLVTSSGINITISDEADYVRGKFATSGTNLIYTPTGRSNTTGYIQYIYGVK